MNHYTWDELEIGLRETFDVTINQKMMTAFAEMTGDVNPLHNDAKFAKKKGYPSEVCFGLLTTSLLSKLAGVYLPGERSLIQSVEVYFVKPVFVGECLTVTGTVCELNDTIEQMVLKVMITNKKDEKVLRGKMKVGLLHD